MKTSDLSAALVALSVGSPLVGRRRFDLRLSDNQPWHRDDSTIGTSSAGTVADCSAEEPTSPDSGFSSDDSSASSCANTPASLFSRSRVNSRSLPSALRRASRQRQHLKKSVRFADAMGLDLATTEYLPVFDESAHGCHSPSASSSRLSLTNFPYRSEQEANHLTAVNKLCVVSLRCTGSTVIGQVNTLNVAFEKKVTVRYTTCNWLSYEEIDATYSHKVHDDVDAFTFSFVLPPHSMKTGRCEFCVRYTVSSGEFWDSNEGRNYAIVEGRSPEAAVPQCRTRRDARASASRQFRSWGGRLGSDEMEPIYIPSRHTL